MAKTRLHRRQAPSNAVSSESKHCERDDTQDENHHVTTCDQHESCQTILKRIVLVIILAAFVATLSSVALISVRHGPQTILKSLKGVQSFFYGDETTATKHTRSQDDTVPSDTHVPQHKASVKSSNPDKAKQLKLDQTGSVGGAGVKLKRDDPEVKAQLPAQHQTDTFRETLLKKLKIRDITVDGRSVIGQELIGNKKRPGAANIR